MKSKKEEKITRKELMLKLKAIKPKTKEERNKLVCVLIGHSNIQTACFGYFNCARCGDQLGDNLAGVYNATGCVILDHNCKTCRANYKKLDWKDKLYCPDPFKEEKKNG